MVNDRLPPADTKDALRRAALRVARSEGMQAASVRSITREAGVTEAVLYRHFTNKDDLWRDIYTRIVREMIRDKQSLITQPLSLAEKLTRWVELTYRYFDGNRDAFTYVLLMPVSFSSKLGDIYTLQGRLLQELIEHAITENQCGHIEPRNAVVMISGLILSVPRAINDGTLTGQAVSHTNDIAHAIHRLLNLEEVP